MAKIKTLNLNLANTEKALEKFEQFLTKLHEDFDCADTIDNISVEEMQTIPDIWKRIRQTQDSLTDIQEIVYELKTKYLV